MKLEEAKRYLKEILEEIEENHKNGELILVQNSITKELAEAIELILKDNARLDTENQKLFEQSLFQDKVIDLICEDYVETNEVLEQYFPPVDEKLLDKEKIKQYFYKKVEEQE